MITPEQIELLFQASQTKFINDEQRATLKLDNPYKHQGKVAEALQREVARINPLQARLWAKEAGATMSLAAAAAQQGLTQMTPGLADEISRMNPQTEQEQQRRLISEATTTVQIEANSKEEALETGQELYPGCRLALVSPEPGEAQRS